MLPDQSALCPSLAQLEERSTFNRVAVGSIPTSGASYTTFWSWLSLLLLLFFLAPLPVDAHLIDIVMKFVLNKTE